jgi:hypothetical protein
MKRRKRLKKFDLDENFLGSLNSHQTLQKALVRIHVDQAFVDSHFPAIPRVSAFTARALSGWDPKPFCRQRDWSAQLHTGAVSDLHDLAANAVQALRVGARQPYPRFIRQEFSSVL